jgi:hypothetical protein
MEHSELVREIEDAIAGYNADIEQLAMISTTTNSDCARVAAVRARVYAGGRGMELLSVSGLLGDMRAEIDVRAIANAVMVAFEQYNVPDDARRAVLAALRSGRTRTRAQQTGSHGWV